jgi:hypothetical protein
MHWADYRRLALHGRGDGAATATGDLRPIDVGAAAPGRVLLVP